jgi:ABC-type multidrug transport system fused ATPase/permease subunit
MEAAGLAPAAYWAGTAALCVGSSLASAVLLVLATVLLGLFSPESFFALLLLAGGFALSLVALGFFLAAACRSVRSVGASVAAVQLIAPLVFVPITWFGTSRGVVTICSLLSPVAFAAAMDIAVQAEAGAEPLTLNNMASQTVGRDAATGGSGGKHPLTAAGAFAMLVLDTVLYAAAAWYAESARQWGDHGFMFRRVYWLGRGAPLLPSLDGGGGGESASMEMEDPTQGGRVEVFLNGDSSLDDDRQLSITEPISGGVSSASPSSSSDMPRLQRRSHRLSPARAPAVKLVDVFAVRDHRSGNLGGGGGGDRGGDRGRVTKCIPSLLGGKSSASSARSGGGRRNVIDGVTLSAYDGQVLALLGHSGSGKSALLEVMGTLKTKLKTQNLKP